MTEIIQAFHAIQTIVEMNNQAERHADELVRLSDIVETQYEEIGELRALVESQRVEISKQQEILKNVQKIARENSAIHHEARIKLRKEIDELDALRMLSEEVAEPRDQPEAQPMQHGP